VATLCAFGARKLARRLGRLRRRRAAAAVTRQPHRELAGGLHISARQAPCADQTTFAGTILDARTGAPIRDAVLRAGEVVLATTARDGRFSVELPPGDHALLAACEGYSPEPFRARLPHAGELAAVEIALVPLRLRILAHLRAAAAPLLPSSAAFDLETPREIGARGDANLRALAELVEKTSYGRAVPGPSDVERAEALARGSLERRNHKG
jgi:hypothetical protein